MGKVIVCKKCKDNKNLKIITPYDKEGIWLICEVCGYELNLPHNSKSRAMRIIYGVYVDCISFAFVNNKKPDLDDIQRYVWERVTEANNEL